MDPFAGERGDGPRADEHVALSIGHQSEVASRVLLVGRWPCDRVGEADVRGRDVHASLARGLREADGGDLWVGEDDAWDGGVVGRSRRAGDVRSGDASLVHADVGERHDAGDVADGPDAISGASVRVDSNALRVGLDADGLETDAFDAGLAAGGDEQLLAPRLMAVAQRDDALTGLEAHLLGTGVEAHIDALLAQDTEDQLADSRVLAVDQPVAALHERDRDAEARVQLAELDADRSATEDDDALRQLLERGRLAVGPVASLLEPGIGGMAASLPVATMMRSVSSVRPSTSMLLGPAIRPSPLTTVTPWRS